MMQKLKSKPDLSSYLDLLSLSDLILACCFDLNQPAFFQDVALQRPRLSRLRPLELLLPHRPVPSLSTCSLPLNTLLPSHIIPSFVDGSFGMAPAS